MTNSVCITGRIILTENKREKQLKDGPNSTWAVVELGENNTVLLRVRLLQDREGNLDKHSERIMDWLIKDKYVLVTDAVLTSWATEEREGYEVETYPVNVWIRHTPFDYDINIVKINGRMTTNKDGSATMLNRVWGHSQKADPRRGPRIVSVKATLPEDVSPEEIPDESHVFVVGYLSGKRVENNSLITLVAEQIII